MKLKNKTFKILSALVSASAITGLATMVVTSCSKETKTPEKLEEKNTSNPTNGVYSVITFDPNGGVLKGDSSIKIRTGKPFGSIKAPVATLTGYTFAGWYDESGAEPVLMEPGTPITQSLTVKAHWDIVQPTILKFQAHTGETVVFKGPTSVEIQEGQTFAEVGRPTAIMEGRDFKGWSFGGDLIEDETQIGYTDFAPGDNIIEPVFFEPKAYAVEISFDEDSVDGVVALQYSPTLTAKVIGQTGVDQKVSWSSTTPTVATVDSNTGKITTVSEGSTKITATSSIDGVQVSASVNITVVSPLEKYPEKIYSEGTFGGSTGYFEVNQDSLCSETAAINLTYAGSSTQTSVKRDEFNAPLFIGQDIQYIGDYFLEGCVVFNSPITFNGDNNNKLFYIGNSFMGDCVAFDNALVLPNNILCLGSDFMYGCAAYSKNFTLSSQLTYVGESFMVGCDNFCDLTVDCEVEAIQAYISIDTLSVSSDEVRAYDPGVSVSGQNADQFKGKFLPIDDPIAKIYRKYA